MAVLVDPEAWSSRELKLKGTFNFKGEFYARYGVHIERLEALEHLSANAFKISLKTVRCRGVISGM